MCIRDRYNKVEIIGSHTDWQTVTICDGNCSNTQVISSLANGEYRVKVNQGGNDGSWCYREEKMNVTTGSTLRASNKIHLATFQNNQQVKLKWVANSLVETYYFLVERSLNGNDFEQLTIVNSFDDNILQWTDEQPQKGINHYRIRQVFFYNNPLYSAIQTEEYFLNKNEITLFPNPCSLIHI